MKTPNLIIRIPEPCHEDWNNMLPDAKGKFCNSCSKAVFDFSTKTDDEIKQILIEYKDQKVCGHFKKSQVDRPLNIKVNLNDLPKNISFSKAFVIAIFLVFGSLLFSCTDQHGGKIETIEIVDLSRESSIDGLIMADMEGLSVDSINAISEALSIDTLADEVNQQEFLGGLIIPELYPEEMLTGDIDRGEEYVEDKLKVEENSGLKTLPMDTVNLNEVPIIEYVMPLIDTETVYFTTTMGAVSIINYFEVIEVEDISNFDSTNNFNKSEVVSDKIVHYINGLNIFPNPNNGDFLIKYDILKKSRVKVDVVNMDGELMKTLVDIANQYEGKYQIPVYLNGLPNGIYLVILTIDDEKLVERVVIER